MEEKCPEEASRSHALGQKSAEVFRLGIGISEIGTKVEGRLSTLAIEQHFDLGNEGLLGDGIDRVLEIRSGPPHDATEEGIVLGRIRIKPGAFELVATEGYW